MLVDMILASDPDHMTPTERMRLASMTAAFLNVRFEEVQVVEVAAYASSRVTIELPLEAAQVLLAAFDCGDPRLFEFLDEVGGRTGVLAIGRSQHGRSSTSDTSERGLEELIVRAMTGRVDVLSPTHVITETSAPVAGGSGWILGDPAHYDREYAVDLVQLHGFLASPRSRWSRRCRSRRMAPPAGSSWRGSRARSASGA